MQLVYLDTSNLSLLSKVQDESPKRLQNFLDLWRSKNFVLAISEAHFFEIMRCEIPKERKSRFDLIEKMLPIRIEKKISDKEVLLAFIQKGILTFKIEGKVAQPKPFSHVISTSDQLSQEIRALDLELLRDLFNMGYEAHKHSWEAGTIDLQREKQRTFRLEDLSTFEMTDEKLKDFREQWRKAKDELRANPNLPKGFLELGTDFIEMVLYDFLENVEREGYLKAVADFIEIDSTDKQILRKPVSSLLNQSGFKFTVKICLFANGFENEMLVEELSNKISIEDCPGLWLGKKIELQIKKSGDKKPSNQLDVEHISHLPYVDVFFSDKRIVEMTKQVSRATNKPQHFENINLPIYVPNNIEALENALFGNL